MRLTSQHRFTCFVAATLSVLPLTLSPHSGPARAHAQTPVTPTGEAQNIRVEQRENSLVHIIYDLVSSDPRASFNVVLQASQDDGSTFGVRPRSITGDTGVGIRAGIGKRIVWDSAKDVERLQIERFRFRVVATGMPLPAVPAKPATEGAAEKTRAAGVLTIATTPAGAQVSIDGKSRGNTPLTLRDLGPGPHRVTVSKAGYEEKSETVEVVAGKEATLDLPLSSDLGAAPSSTKAALPQPVKGGNGKMIAILGGAGAAAAAGVLAAGGGGDGGGSSGEATSRLNNTPFDVSGTVAAGSPNQQISDHNLGPAPRNGTLNATLGWTPSQSIILRFVILLDGIDSSFAPLSCSFLNAPDCASSRQISVSSPVRQGAQVILRVISFSQVPVNYIISVGFQ